MRGCDLLGEGALTARLRACELSRSQGQPIAVNRSVLFVRCEAFAKQALSASHGPGSPVVLSAFFVARSWRTPVILGSLGAKIDPEAFKAFVEFLYTDDVEELSSESMRQLLQLAKQFNLPRLIAVCRDFFEPSRLVADFNGMQPLAFPSKRKTSPMTQAQLPSWARNTWTSRSKARARYSAPTRRSCLRACASAQ